MSDLSAIEKRKLERALGMGSGYVLNFSNRTFEEFFADSFRIEIYDSRYDYGSGSKANRLRAFWEKEPNHVVGKVLGLMFEEWAEFRLPDSPEVPPEECLKIVRRLKDGAPVPDLDALTANIQDTTFETLAKSVKDCIDKNEPETGLDRLHTFLVKYFRVLHSKHGIAEDRDKPLHSLVGEYIKVIKLKGLIASEMTERILKSTISVMEAFNRVRNDQSLAHDNQMLNYHESLLIFNHVASSIRFIEALETKPKKAEVPEPVSYDDDIPF